MKIESIKFFSVKGDSNLKAMVSFCLGGKITFHSWKVLDSSKGLFVAPPSQKSGDKYFSMVFINDNSMRDEIQEKLLEEYEKWSTSEKPKTKSKSKTKKVKDDDDDDEESGLPF